MVKIDVNTEILLIWTNVVNSNVFLTNVIMTYVEDGSRKQNLKFGQDRVSNSLDRTNVSGTNEPGQIMQKIC